MNKTKPSLAEFRRETKLDQLQKDLLEQSWECFQEGGTWLALRQLNSRYGKDEVKKAISRLGGNVGQEIRDSQKKWTVYRLTLLGVLLTKNGVDYEKLLLRFLECQRECYQQEPLKPYIEAAEIEETLKLNQAQIPMLGQLIALGFLGGSESPRTDWVVEAMSEAEDFSPQAGFSPDLDKVIFRYYKPDAPVFEEDRRANESPASLQGFFEPTLPTFAMEGAPPPPKSSHHPNTAFIIMQMDKSLPELEDVVETIKRVCNEFKIKAVRADDVEHQERITDVILKHIRESEFLIADLSGERPNVYYEVGFAHAIAKRPILFQRKGTRTHFDLAAFNVPEYGNITELQSLLRKRFEASLGQKPKLSRRRNR